MPTYVTIDAFLELADDVPVVDVRSPCEFRRAHIPGAHNIPLFDDSQRSTIGTTYQEAGRTDAVLQGLEFVGTKMRSMAQQLLATARAGQLLIHCWRGGMRSRSVGWLAEQVDIEVFVLQGGYKSFRRHVLSAFKKPLNLFVVSGLTGAGKTLQIELLREEGEQAIDLEELASHRGSAFGGIGLQVQPTTEHFENCLFHELQQLDRNQRIWVEDESRNIGSIKLPHHFFAQLRMAPAIFMDVDQAIRNQLIFDEYGSHSIDELRSAIMRIEKKLGGQNVRMAVGMLENSQIRQAIDLLLEYYDRLYLTNKHRLRRNFYVDLKVESPTCSTTTRQLIRLAQTAPGSGTY